MTSLLTFALGEALGEDGLLKGVCTWELFGDFGELLLDIYLHVELFVW